jgi:Tfp pilus assembly protein PilO
MEYPQQTQLVRPTNTGRINWTQTTTMIVAAFIGCLLALFAGLMLYKHLMAKKIKQEATRLDQIKLTYQQQETALGELAQKRKEQLAPVAATSVGATSQRVDAKQESKADEAGSQETGSENKAETSSEETPKA